ncbi:MAG: helix-turn-helix domain-containing protein [Clostridia bacterium]|nr:helix-turn-helix domain-containing protein [Clostridia bacterium]MBR2296170.1 helix-turn-helix domain-containing protein [Clostridia bacterium]
MSNRLFQGVIHQMHDAVDRVIGVIDNAGAVIACSELSKIGEIRAQAREELSFTTDMTVIEGYTYQHIGSSPNAEFAVFVEGEDKIAEKYSAILAISLANIKNYYDEKFDKSSFIKNIIMDNILPSDIYAKSRELRFDSNDNRVVLLVRFYSRTELLPFDIIQNMFPDKTKDYVIAIGEQDIVIVKELVADTSTASIEALAQSISDTLSTEFYCRVGIGIGTVVDNIKDLARSYKEAQIAIEVGKVFESEKEIVSYENLGIGRLIYQLPTTLCEIFLSEVFKHGSLETLDKETLQTIQVFFENNLNVSETSRKLFVHRNTLVYRLEKIKKLTGLDLREFDHAITFKVALMVRRYLTAKPIKF